MRGTKENPCMTCHRCRKKMCFLCNNVWHEGKIHENPSKIFIENVTNTFLYLGTCE